MKLKVDNSLDLTEISQKIVQIVDQVMGQFDGLFEAREKKDGSIVTAVDEALQRAIQKWLKERWPEIPFLGEEMPEQDQLDLLQRKEGFLWCLDPLDGTTNFSVGLPYYSVSLALLDGGNPVLGIVYDPERREVYSARQGEGSFLNQMPLKAPQSSMTMKGCVANIDFKRLSQELSVRLAKGFPFRSQRNMGSCALEFCWLASDRFQLYLHGGMKIWDYAAGFLILKEAGGYICTLEGDEVVTGQPGALTVIAANRENLFKDWRDFMLELQG